jgi:hypothetical protein
MAITKNPLAADTPEPYTVTRAFYWGGEVQAVGSGISLTKAEAAPLIAANKVVAGEPPKPSKAAKADKASDSKTPSTSGASE